MSDTTMDHRRIEDEGIADLYVLGQLPAGEAQRFEEHFLGCAECLDRVEEAERLREALTRAAVRRAEAAATVARVAAAGGLLALWGRLRRGQRFALAAAGLGLVTVGAVVPSVFLLGRTARLDRQLAAVRTDLARRPPAAAGGRSVVPPAPQAAAQAQIRRLTQEAATERAAAARLAGELARARAPMVDVPVLALSVLRGAPGASPAPPPAVRLPASAAWVVVSMEPTDPGFPRYRIVLTRHPAAAALWESEPTALGAAGLVTLALPRTLLLPPGDFLLRVEGLPSGRSPVPAGEFPFRVDNP